MLKIHGFNEKTYCDDDVVTVRTEAQKDHVFELYAQTLRLQNDGATDEALKQLIALVEEKIPQLESSETLRLSIRNLEYSCCLNIGNLYLERGKVDKALRFYHNASKLDTTDVGLWYKIGTLALKQNHFQQATHAFLVGLDNNKNHWRSLDHLVSLLYSMKSYILCSSFINEALRLDPSYAKGIAIRRKIFIENPVVAEIFRVRGRALGGSEINPEEQVLLAEEECFIKRLKEVEDSLSPESVKNVTLSLTDNYFNWLSLGREIIKLHEEVTRDKKSYFTSVDISISSPEIILVENLDVTVEGMNVSEMICSTPNVTKYIQEQQDTPTRISIDSFTSVPEGQKQETSVYFDRDFPKGQDREINLNMGHPKSEEIKAVKALKRKRNLLSDLQIWGWHSKRRSLKKSQSVKELCVRDAIRKIIPGQLLETGFDAKDTSQDSSIAEKYSMNYSSTSFDPLPMAENNQYFNTTNEKQDISTLLSSINQQNVTFVVKKFVFDISNMWQIKWSEELVNVYSQLYLLFRQHYDIPMVLNEGDLSLDVRQDALATLTYLEVQDKVVDPSITNYLRSVGCRLQNDDIYVPFMIRLNWLEANCSIKQFHYESAIATLHLIQELITLKEDSTNDNYSVLIPNFKDAALINKEIIGKMISQLDVVKAINSVEELYSLGRYEEVAEILKQTMDNQTNCQPLARMHRTAQLIVLLHSLWYINITDCFVFLEACMYEAVPQLVKKNVETNKWEKLIGKCCEMFREIIEMESLIIVDCLSMEKRARLLNSLCEIVCYQLNSGCGYVIPLNTVSPWIVMHHILEREEHRQRAEERVCHVTKDSALLNSSSDLLGMKNLPPSIAILICAHEFLGPKGWCLTNNGELLHLMLTAILDKLESPMLESLRGNVDMHLEQAFFCLYQHPSKKNKGSRHLADHNVDPISLSWENSFQLFEFYGPSVLPEYNSYKNASISVDLEQLLHRILALVPSDIDPQQKLCNLMDYIQGKRKNLPDIQPFPSKLRSIYYLIGDFYFKQREFEKCMKYLKLDLCINNSRLDSWACMGLSYASQLENKLNYCQQLKSEEEFLEMAQSARICFKKALELGDHLVLWIECGSFEYMIHSFCSRILKSNSDMLSMERFQYLEDKKNNYLESSTISFNKAINLYQRDESEADERWLQHYMLGKIAEKQQKEPSQYLRHYVTAGKLLHENNALYPYKINYQNPQHLSVEALEMHYRLHASTLKYLELHDAEDCESFTGNVFNYYLDKSRFPSKSLRTESSVMMEVENEPLQAPVPTATNEDVVLVEVRKCLADLVNYVETYNAGSRRVTTTVPDQNVNVSVNYQDMFEVKQVCAEASKTDRSAHENIPAQLKDVNVDFSSVINEDSLNEHVAASVSSAASTTSDADSHSSSSTASEKDFTNKKDDSVRSLVDRCILGLEDCIIRLSPNYKALYRLAHVYYNSKFRRDIMKSKKLLLGEYTSEGGVTIPGLFSERKQHNFFNGIWRIPSSEVDRPGSLSAHMNRCVTLLLQVLRDTNDYQSLLDVSLQLKKSPDPDKVYIQDAERLQFSKQAFIMCIRCIKGKIQNSSSRSDLERLFHELVTIHQKLKKFHSAKERVFASMVTDVYKKLEALKVHTVHSLMNPGPSRIEDRRIIESNDLSSTIQKKPASDVACISDDDIILVE